MTRPKWLIEGLVLPGAPAVEQVMLVIPPGEADTVLPLLGGHQPDRGIGVAHLILG
jgi:hypothetical protein